MKKDKKQAKIFHFDLYGKRQEKYDFLNENAISSMQWNELKPEEPNFFFVNKNTEGQEEYEKGFKVDELFTLNASGIKTERDNLTIHFDDKLLNEIERAFEIEEIEIIRKKYSPKPDGRDWKMATAKEDLLKSKKIKTKVLYRPFDIRRTIYTGKSKGFHSYPRNEVMKHLIKENYALIFERSATIGDFTNILISNCLVECHVLGTAFSFGYTAPLYLYQDEFGKEERTPNLNPEIVSDIEKSLGLQFVAEKDTSATLSVSAKIFAPIDILDYIYAVLHSPTYRRKYKEFLKIDFPRVPFPKNKTMFWKLVALGKQIREIHLLESPVVENYITQYPIDGTNVVDKPKYVPIPKNEKTGILQGNVYLNDTQYFANVPLSAWSFYIGGYQPAQKWLKDRKNRKLEFDDILHYQKIIVALTETDSLMKEIDTIN